MKAAVQIQLPEASRKLQGQRELVALLSREPPVTDAELLGTIEDFVVSNGFQDALVLPIWDRAITYQPRNEELLKSCFRRKFNKRDFRVATKVCLQAAGGCVEVRIGAVYLLGHCSSISRSACAYTLATLILSTLVLHQKFRLR